MGKYVYISMDYDLPIFTLIVFKSFISKHGMVFVEGNRFVEGNIK